MAGMPYHLEKGPVLAVIEAYLNGPIDQPRTFLQRLWHGHRLGSFGLITSPSADQPPGQPPGPNATGPQRLESLLSKWFGESRDAAGNVVEQAPFDSANPTATGYWAGYHGDVRAIMTQTLQRTVEVALGVPNRQPVRPDDPPPPMPTGNRRWDIDLYWRCGQSRFEGWVTWRAVGANRGHVVTVFATPATPDVVLDAPAAKAKPALDTGDRGMVVVTHASHVRHQATGTQPTPLGTWHPAVVPLWVEGTGPVGAWSPSFGDGGVPDVDVEYTAPAAGVALGPK